MFATHDIELITPTRVTDARGVRRADWDNPASITTIRGVNAYPGATDEQVKARSTVTIRWTVIIPFLITISPHQAVRLGGRLYQIDGEPGHWVSPTGALNHMELLLIDFKG